MAATATPRNTTTRRTWPQRLTIVALVVASLASFATAAGLATGQWIVSSRNLVVLEAQQPSSGPAGGPTVVVTPDRPLVDTDGDGVPDAPTTTDGPPPTFPTAEPGARNFLVTGADNNACVDPDSPFAGAFGDRSGFGERSDTIMVWRVNPDTRQVAVLSFPRDLWVDLPDGGRGRINGTYRAGDPERLRATILQNFGIPIDHFVEVDFCAFKRIVDAVGGVEVPFEYPARDPRSGLNVPEIGCYNFTGEHALAYVRSRYYEYEDPPGSGNWRRDGTSDLGRIARQQDFLRRVVATVLGRGMYTPSVVAALIDTNSRYLTIDSGLTLNRMLEFAGVLQTLQPGAIGSFQIQSERQIIAGNDVLVPRLGGDNMQAVLAVFRGEAAIADAPDQVDDTAPPSTTAPDGPDVTAAPPGSSPSSDDTTATTLPEVAPEENLLGVAPPRDATC